MAKTTIVRSPFTIVVDTREQLPYTFADLRSRAREGRRPVLVTSVRGTLGAGDYSIRGFESRVAVERKSLSDLYHTLGRERERFVRELERLQEMEWAAVVVEASYGHILCDPPERSGLDPRTILPSIYAWSQRFPGVHWFPMENRPAAEAATYRLLERFWKESETRKETK